MSRRARFYVSIPSLLECSSFICLLTCVVYVRCLEYFCVVYVRCLEYSGLFFCVYMYVSLHHPLAETGGRLCSAQRTGRGVLTVLL